MKYKASIIIRTFNEEDWIGHCLSAIKKQKFKKYEVIIVDNYSKDNTIKIAKSFNIRKIIKIKKFIPGKALNLGSKAAKGEFLVYISAHCIPEKNTWLGSLISNFKNPKVAAVYGKQSPIKYSDAEDIRDLYITFGNERKIQKKDYFFHNANSAIRRSIWKKIKFSNNLTNIEDRHWSKKIIDLKHWIIYEPKSNVFHYHGIHHGSNRERLKKTIGVIEKIESKNFLTIPDTLRPENIKLLIVLNFTNYKKNNICDTAFNKICFQINNLKINKKIIFIKPKSFLSKSVPKNFQVIKKTNKLSLVKILKNSISKSINKSFFSDYVLYLNGDYLFRPENLINDIINQICFSGFEAIIPTYKNFNTNFVFDKNSMSYKIYGKELKNRSQKKPFFSSLYGLGSIVKTSIASKGLLISDNKNGLYNIKNKIQSLRITDIDKNSLKNFIK